ncbi:MAG: hypothetical protein WCP79_02335 [Bacillota bacterium]
MKFQSFDKPFGQIEVGGKYAGMAFHAGSAMPSRISFFYPVANSISNSQDYWKRYESHLFNAVLTVDGQAQTIGYDEHQAEYTPCCFRATKQYHNCSCRYEYSFGSTLPITVIKIELTNTGQAPAQYTLDLTPETAFHSCHSFNRFQPERTFVEQNGALLVADFSSVVDLGNSSLFFLNAGATPQEQHISETVTGFHYAKLLSPGETLGIVLIVGCCKAAELAEMIQRVQRDWAADIAANSERIDDYIATRGTIAIGDPALAETIAWSKGVHASLQHYLDDWYLPMPCPAEYNFFFTHDFLVHGLGWAYFDLDYIKNGYEYLLSLDAGDNVLSHACYWKDNAYYSEPCPPTDWNNLWIINSVSSYLKHSADKITAERLLPMLQTSLDRILLNFDDGLMKAYFPDWWDFGTNYGARAYISILTYRAIHNFTYIVMQLGQPDLATKYYPLAEIIRSKLNEQLWHEKSGYLLNELADGSLDKHYYSGSLLAANFGLLDEIRSNQLLDTARDVLLDDNCGVHNVAPADFVGLEEKYGFHNVEQGENGYYINGGVWTQCNAWYALSLITLNRVDEAYQVLKKHLSIAGIAVSHNGQPSFYEARITAKDANYGKIDKPTFLWHGGWFMLTLYQLLGIRETPWNIELHPITATELIDSKSEIKNHGEDCIVEFSGSGNYFQEIVFDGDISYSAILTASCQHAELLRGTPTVPYLSEARCIIENVAYDTVSGELAIAAKLAPHQQLDVTIILPVDYSLTTSCPDILVTAQSANARAKTFLVRSNQANIILQVQ